MTIPTNQVDNNVDAILFIKLEGGPAGGKKTIPIKNNIDPPPGSHPLLLSNRLLDLSVPSSLGLTLIVFPLRLLDLTISHKKIFDTFLYQSPLSP